MGCSIGAGSVVDSVKGYAQQLGENAKQLVRSGTDFVDGLAPPDFGLAPSHATAPIPRFNKPQFDSDVVPSGEDIRLGGLDADLKAPDKRFAISWTPEDSPRLGIGVYDLSVSAPLPSFTWSPPSPPGLVSISALNAAPTVGAPVAIQLPDVSGIDIPRPEEAPIWDATVEFDTSGAPGAKPSLPTLAAPMVAVPVLPAAPEWSSPKEVALSEITLPTLIPLNLPNTTGISVPSLVLPELQGRLDFADEAFDESLIQELMAEIRAVLGGRLAIPSHIWTRIWERVAADVNRQYLARKREAQRAHAKLGWSMPGGVLLEALQVAATDINAEISAKANEIAIKQAEMQQADYWQAMQQGVACTTLLSQIHNARQERLLKAAIATLEAQVTAYNAVVAAYNARVQAIVSEIEIKKLQLQAELTKVEVYKTEMEGAKLGVEVDKAKVEMYVAQWGAVKTQAEAYESMVRGVAAQVEAQKAAVEAYGEQVKAQSLVVQMWATEWDAYAKKLESEKLKLGKFEAEARVFESRVSRYRAAIEGQSSRSGVQIEAKKLELQRAQIDATRYQADWGGEQTKLAGYEAYLKGVGFPLEAAKINADIYQAHVQGELGRVQAWMAPYDAYSKLIQKDAVRAQLQSSYASLFGAHVQHAALGVELSKIAADLEKTYEQLLQEYNKTKVSEHQAEAQYKAAQLSAKATGYSAAAEVYKADVQAETAIAGVEGDIYKTSADIATANGQFLVEGAKILTAQWQTQAQITQAQYQAAASVYAQLGAAAYAATNASISESRSCTETKSHGYDVNVSVPIDEVDGGLVLSPPI